jgi:hypothetical protein
MGRWQPGQHRITFHGALRNQPDPRPESPGSEPVRLVPRCESRYHDAGVGGDHRRMRSSVSRTWSDVRGGSFARGTATRDFARPFKLIRVAGTSISMRPSLTSRSSSCPGRTPRASRSALGTTSRPAESMVVFMAELYHGKWHPTRDTAAKRSKQVVDPDNRS